MFTYETGCVVNAGTFFISERSDGSQVAVGKQADICIQMGCFSGLLVFQCTIWCRKFVVNHIMVVGFED